MTITKVALVDEGACSAAHIKIVKRRNDNMTFEEIMKTLSADQQALINAEISKRDTAVAEAEKNIAKAKEDKAAAEKAQQDAEMEKTKAEEALAEAQKAGKKDTEKDSEEEIMKSASPAMKALLEKMKAQASAAEAIAKKALEEQVNKEAIAKAKTVANIPSEETTLVDLYKSLKGFDGKVADQVFDILAKADAVVAKSKAFSSTGIDGEAAVTGTSDEAWAVIEKAAEPIAKAKNCSKEQAVTEVIKTSPELYSNYLKALQ